MNSRIVASHYNARPQLGRDRRRDSVIFQLKNLNNWVKSVLIGKFITSNASVLDFACGKGGDLQKWAKSRVWSLVGVDIADISIQHARQRFEEGRFTFSAEFHVMDCFAGDLNSLLASNISFDFVSCQFALHYCAESKEQTLQALHNISTRLKSGGHFVGTVPNAYRILKRLNNCGTHSFGNSIYKITFEHKTSSSLYGHKYWFELADAIDNCPEYVFNFPEFIKLASQFGLDLVYQKNFHELFMEEKDNPENFQLLKRMNVLNDQGTISVDEWEASGLYFAFAFKKR